MSLVPKTIKNFLPNFRPDPNTSSLLDFSKPLSTSSRHSENQADELHHVSTTDGVQIGLWAYKSNSSYSTDKRPVLLVHGLGANHRNLAFDERYGVAQYLNRRGFDCWAVDLRGRGASDIPSHWMFDDYAKNDLPASINYILRKSQSSKLHWVGHSMGGMLFYALAGALDYQDSIASAVTLGSPVDFPEPSILYRLAAIFHALPFGTKLKTPKAITSALGTVYDLIPDSLHSFLYNPNNVNKHALIKVALTISAGTSSKVLTQFPHWFANDQWMDSDQRIDYRGGVSTVGVPSLVIAGAVDKISPPDLIESGYEDLKSRKKKFIRAGKTSGYQRNYSHIDLVFGKRARKEIFPLISDWLDQHPRSS